MNEQDKEFIREVIRETILELKKGGLLRDANDIAYSEANALLRGYYRQGESDKAIADALKKVQADPYFKIIPLYFSYGYTIEDIAEVFDVEVSTISRNKKRLCLAVYNLIR